MNKYNPISKINVEDFLFLHKGMKIPTQFPLFRQYQRTWLTYKSSPHPATLSSSSKHMKSRKANIPPTHLPSLSTFSIPATISSISTINDNHGHTTTAAGAASSTAVIVV